MKAPSRRSDFFRKRLDEQIARNTPAYDGPHPNIRKNGQLTRDGRRTNIPEDWQPMRGKL